jgi:hypothetical protein
MDLGSCSFLQLPSTAFPSLSMRRHGSVSARRYTVWVRRFMKKPNTPFGCINPALEQTGRRQLTMLVTQLVCPSHVLNQLEVVVS